MGSVVHAHNSKSLAWSCIAHVQDVHAKYMELWRGVLGGLSQFSGYVLHRGKYVI